MCVHDCISLWHCNCLGGFSQGGAIALYAGVTAEKQLAGITALGTYFPLDHNVFQVKASRTHLSILYWMDAYLNTLDCCFYFCIITLP